MIDLTRIHADGHGHSFGEKLALELARVRKERIYSDQCVTVSSIFYSSLHLAAEVRSALPEARTDYRT